MDLIKLFAENLMLLTALIGVFAFLVSVITEATKNLGFLKKIPTDLQVIVLAIILCQVAYFAYISYFSVEIQWYYIAGAFVAAFIVALVAMDGWEKLTNLYNRFKK
jgi:hypothetical protein